MNQKEVRVRFAPSPTGPLHIGGVRTALYNYLFAKKNNGKFILRIEDTDQTRFVEGAEKYIIESLEWCGIKIDESENQGGDFGPYKQSLRKDIYKKYAFDLVDNDFAYFAFDTPDELNNLRTTYEQQKKVFVYNSQVRNDLNNSIKLGKQKSLEKINSGENFVIRFKIPDNQELILQDLIRGEIKINTSTLDDKILFKSDGMPTYHLANIVDDYLMKISHVIRGEEWLPSLPLHVLLYKALGWESEMPQFAHLPLLLKPTGNGKLSKRDGDKMGFPVFPLFWKSPTGDTATGYREEGYFADAFINMLALLGWNPGTEQEIFTMHELINLFDISRVNKSGAKFDPEKAKWFNHQYLQKKSNKEIAELFNKKLIEKNISADLDYTEKVVSLVKERVSFIKEIWEQASFFYIKPVEYDNKVVKKRWKEGMSEKLNKIIDILNNINDFSRDKIHDEIVKFIETNEFNMGQIMNSIRLSLVGGAKGPDLFTIIEMLGKQETVNRIKTAIDIIKK